MHPQLDFVIFEVSAYRVFSILALIVVVAGSYLYARKRSFNSLDAIVMLVCMGIAAFIGARVFNLLVHFDWYLEDPTRFFSLNFEGFSLYGGALFAGLAGFVVARLRKVKILKFADTVIPFVGIGIAIMRIGCFLNGCCFGKETDLPWGVKFPALSQSHVHHISENLFNLGTLQAVHPTQIYELIAALIGTVLAFVLIKKKKPAGTAFFGFIAWFSLFRLFNMQLRVLPYSDFITFYFYPILYVLIIILCVFYILKLNKK